MSSPALSSGSLDSLDSFDSLFDEAPETAASDLGGAPLDASPSASITPPPIPGLFVFPSLLDPDVARSTLEGIASADYFVGGTRDQVMFFVNPTTSALPAPCPALLSHLRPLLRPLLPVEVHRTVFDQDPLPRQAILNLYAPGQGIAPHTDLPGRYADGILGVSIVGSAVMAFAHPVHGRVDVHLPPRSVYVMVGPARWEWTHGIEGRQHDVVEGRTVVRDVRVSATFRWMKPGADVLS